MDKYYKLSQYDKQELPKKCYSIVECTNIISKQVKEEYSNWTEICKAVKTIRSMLVRIDGLVDDN